MVKVGDRVRLKYGIIGIVKDRYPTDENEAILVIKIKEKEWIKCLESKVVIVEDEQENKGEVTITEEQFKNLVTNKAVTASKGDYTMGLLFTLFGATLAKELFGDKTDND